MYKNHNTRLLVSSLLIPPMIASSSDRTNLNLRVASLRSNSNAGDKLKLEIKTDSDELPPALLLNETSFLTSVSNKWKSTNKQSN